jgi:hypothetical protein
MIQWPPSARLLAPDQREDRSRIPGDASRSLFRDSGYREATMQVVKTDTEQLKRPTTDEKLSSGSIIHWPKIKHVYLTDVRKPYYQWRVPVTCGACGKRRGCRLYRVTEVEVLSKENLASRKGDNFTGLCPKGHARKYFGDQILSTGSIIHWGRRDKEEKGKVPITCGKCGKKHFRKHGGSLTGKRLLEEIKGYCRICANNERTGDEEHHSGTTIHWDEREDSKTRKNQKVAITCHGCNKKKFVWLPKGDRADWPGLCSDCLHKRPSPKKFTHNVTLNTGSTIRYRERDKNDRNKVLVICGLPRCGKRHFVHIQQAEGRRGEKFTGFCPTHSIAEIAQLLQSGAHGSAEKREKQKLQRRDEWLLEAVNGVANLWEKAQTWEHKKYEQKLDTITEAALASYLGSHTTEDKYRLIHTRRRLMECKVDKMFAGSGSWFKRFVKFTVECVEQKIISEAIVSRLQARLSNSRRAA